MKIKNLALSLLLGFSAHSAWAFVALPESGTLRITGTNNTATDPLFLGADWAPADNGYTQVARRISSVIYDGTDIGTFYDFVYRSRGFAGVLLDAVGEYVPRLLFLSACLTSAAAEAADMAETLVTLYPMPVGEAGGDRQRDEHLGVAVPDGIGELDRDRPVVEVVGEGTEGVQHRFRIPTVLQLHALGFHERSGKQSGDVDGKGHGMNGG